MTKPIPRKEYTIRMTVDYSVLAYEPAEAEEEAYFQLERDIKSAGVQFTYELLDVDVGEYDLSEFCHPENA
jgi:hypothetical protein